MGYVLVLFVVMLAMVFVMPLIVLLAWNEVIPKLFKLPLLEYWDAFWLFMLTSILFKSSSVSSDKD